MFKKISKWIKALKLKLWIDPKKKSAGVKKTFRW